MQSNNHEDNDENDDIDKIVDGLKGNTLLVYWFMLRQVRPYRAREIQRKVGFSSSSLALHHLSKLIELDLVTTNSDGYYILKRRIKPGLLSLFVGTGIFFVPRFAFYATLNTALLVSCLYIFGWRFDSAIFVLLLVLLINSIVFWIESLKMWRLQPL
ncbi:MAG: hypothetical protein RTV72_05425 [Candidatus Thorarchaeota archaeon]